MKERLLLFLDYLHMSNRAFEQKVGLTNGYVSNFSAKAHTDKLEMIFRTFPELSRDWLMNGTGDMIKSEQTVYNERNTAELISLLKMSIEEIRAQRIQIDRLIDAMMSDRNYK